MACNTFGQTGFVPQQEKSEIKTNKNSGISEKI
jgi:hypothetical protein